MGKAGIHGGDVYRNKVRFDFSSNINPLGLDSEIESALNKSVASCTRYPDIEYRKLRETIARMEGCPSEWVMCGNGASELFLAIVHALHPAKTLIPVPSFYGYERAALAGGSELCFYQMNREDDFQLTEEIYPALTEDLDLLFLANPNNPVGNRIAPELLGEILDCCRRKHITVVLDECFYDFLLNRKKESILCYAAQFPELIVVKAFTKIYAIPGVRLGYLVCADAEKREPIALQLPEWNLSTFAQAAGIAAAEAVPYRRKTPEYVAKERDFLVKGLQKIAHSELLDPCEQKERPVSEKDIAAFPRLTVYPAEANFLMLHTDYPLSDALLREGILIRDCSNFRGLGKGYYRIAVRTRAENEALLRTIKKVTENERT